MPSPLISVVITSIPGRMAFLEEALQSLATQTIPPGEVVLVLEGEDPAWDGLDVWKTRLPLRIFHHPEVSGRAGPAKTRGIRAARGRFVALLDDDDLALRHRLEVEWRFLESHPQYGWVCGRVERFSGERVEEIWPQAPAGDVDLARLFQGNVVAYSTVLLTRKAVNVLKGFREDLPLAPDYEAWLRLAAHGVKGFLMDDVLARYRIHAGNVSAREVVRARTVVQILNSYRNQVDPATARRALRRAYRDLARAMEREGRGREAARVWWAAWREARYVRDLGRSVMRWIFG